MEGLGRGWSRPVGSYRYRALDTRFSVSEGVGDGSPRSCCMICLLESNPMTPRRSQLTSAGSPARYLLFTPVWWAWSRLAMAERGVIWSVETPFGRWDTPWTQYMKYMLLSPHCRPDLLHSRWYADISL